MRKIISVIIGVIFMIAFVVLLDVCVVNASTPIPKELMSVDGVNTKILIDPETRVQYIVITEGSLWYKGYGVAITPRYDSEGKVMIERK